MTRESAHKRGGAGSRAAQAQSYAAQGDAQRRKGAEAAPRCGELPYVVQTTCLPIAHVSVHPSSAAALQAVAAAEQQSQRFA